jgi:hypothetical protein
VSQVRVLPPLLRPGKIARRKEPQDVKRSI